jgi:hypothetical protein
VMRRTLERRQHEALRALQYCGFTAMFGEASCMEENSHDFVEVLERSIRTADGTLYDQEDVQDAASLACCTMCSGCCGVG